MNIQTANQMKSVAPPLVAIAFGTTLRAVGGQPLFGAGKSGKR